MSGVGREEALADAQMLGAQITQTLGKRGTPSAPWAPAAPSSGHTPAALPTPQALLDG